MKKLRLTRQSGVLGVGLGSCIPGFLPAHRLQGRLGKHRPWPCRFESTDHSLGSKMAFRKSPPRPTSQSVPPGVLRRPGTRQSAEAGGVSSERPTGASSPRHGMPREGRQGSRVEGTLQVPGVTLPKRGVPGRGLGRGSRCSHLPTAPAPAPPGSRAPRRAAAPPPEGIRGRPWPVAETFPPPGACRPAAAARSRQQAGRGRGCLSQTRARARAAPALERAGDARARLRGGATLARVRRAGPRPATLKNSLPLANKPRRRSSELYSSRGRQRSGGRGRGTEAAPDTRDPYSKLTSMSPR